MDCTGGSTKTVKYCEFESCPLYFYRMGKNPNRAGKGGQGIEFNVKTHDTTQDLASKKQKE